MSKERAGGLIFLFAGMYGLFFSIQFPMGKWNEPGAGVFPLSLSILLCLSGGLWFILGTTKGEKKRINWRGIWRDLVTPLQIALLTGAFILGLKPAGYLVASSLYLFILFFWISHYKLWTAASLAATLGVGSWYFFGRLLDVQLPAGFLPL